MPNRPDPMHPSVTKDTARSNPSGRLELELELELELGLGLGAGLGRGLHAGFLIDVRVDFM
ncbi:hypothetical protein PSCICG_13260 [Pseudomonas cichorii]|nr:hypothetical protein PSCICG_13260 [Pseudomonas cichorii]